MNQSPEISVIMPVYNENIHDLRDSINSILNQTYRNFEYIIIDDNPINKEIKKYLFKISNNNKNVRVIFHKKNHGLIYSENEGIIKAKGHYVARLDADDISKVNRLKIQLSFLKKYELNVVCSNFSVINVKGKVTRKYGYNGETVINQTILKHKLSHCNIVINPTLFFDKSVFNKLNGYRDTKINKSNVEDYDFAVRALIYGYDVGYLGKPLIYKRLRKDSISGQTIYSQYIIMNTISGFLRKTHFKKDIPLNFIRCNLKNTSNKQLVKFHNFVNYRYLFNNHETIKNGFFLFCSIITSLTVLKWCIWALKNKFYQ